MSFALLPTRSEATNGGHAEETEGYRRTIQMYWISVLIARETMLIFVIALDYYR